MAERLVFHCDCNNFFASCECLERPELKDVPMAVAGDPEERVGVVVAKNELAKKFGVKTTDTVWQARKKCPEIHLCKDYFRNHDPDPPDITSRIASEIQPIRPDRKDLRKLCKQKAFVWFLYRVA